MRDRRPGEDGYGSDEGLSYEESYSAEEGEELDEGYGSEQDSDTLADRQWALLKRLRATENEIIRLTQSRNGYDGPAEQALLARLQGELEAARHDYNSAIRNWDSMAQELSTEDANDELFDELTAELQRTVDGLAQKVRDQQIFMDHAQRLRADPTLQPEDISELYEGRDSDRQQLDRMAPRLRALRDTEMRERQEQKAAARLYRATAEGGAAGLDSGGESELSESEDELGQATPPGSPKTGDFLRHNRGPGPGGPGRGQRF